MVLRIVLARLESQGARTGAGAVSRAFVEGSMEHFLEEMDEAGIALAVVQGRNSPERFKGTRFNAWFIANERIASLQRDHPGGSWASPASTQAAPSTTRW